MKYLASIFRLGMETRPTDGKWRWQGGPERWLSSYEDLLLLQTTRVQYPISVISDSLLPITLAPGDVISSLVPASPHVCVCVCTYMYMRHSYLHMPYRAPARFSKVSPYKSCKISELKRMHLLKFTNTLLTPVLRTGSKKCKHCASDTPICLWNAD